MIIGVGVALIVLGVAAYVLTGMVSVTALIPAFFGIVLAGLGGVALKDRFRMACAYGVMGIGVLGLLGSISGIPNAIAYLSGGDVARPAASMAQSIMALMMLVLVAVLAKALIDERRQARVD